MATDNDFLDDIDDSNENEETTDPEMNIEYRELANKRALEQANRNLLARKRIDDLLENKKLKELLDNSDDW